MLALVSPRASSAGPLEARLLSTLYLDPCTNNIPEHKHLSCDPTLFCIISYLKIYSSSALNVRCSVTLSPCEGCSNSNCLIHLVKLAWKVSWSLSEYFLFYSEHTHRKCLPWNIDTILQRDLWKFYLVDVCSSAQQCLLWSDYRIWILSEIILSHTHPQSSCHGC